MKQWIGRFRRFGIWLGIWIFLCTALATTAQAHSQLTQLTQLTGSVALSIQMADIQMAEAPVTSVQAAESEATGAEIFAIHCAGCHINGGNIIRRGKTLKLKALQKYGMDSIAAITEIVTNGKANMSAYRDRLTPAEIQTVATYVLQQAETGW